MVRIGFADGLRGHGQEWPCYGMLLLLCCVLSATAQHTWQKPKPLMPEAKVRDIIGPIESQALSRPLEILWVWGFDKGHAPGSHDFTRIRDLMQGLLGQVKGVTVTPVFGFPTKAQFAQADLACMYLHLPDLSEAQFADFTAYIEGGGGVVAIHETTIIRPSAAGKRLSACFGRAWDNDRSKWGALFADISLEPDQAILKGFGDTLTIVDEFYWDLHSQVDGLQILGRVPVGPPKRSAGPLPLEKLSEKKWPVLWTYERGEGRVFATTTGHNTFSFYDPELRIILFRAMAWTVREKPGPFMPLVFEGITNDGLVGTTDTFRDWKGKPRGSR